MFGKPASPPPVSADTVTPLHFFDDTPLWRAFILYSMFVFDDVLDATKLRDSLETLTQQEGWRKLGARLRKNKNGDLEYHIPAVFSKDRPSLSFTHVTHASNADAHPIASQLPRPSVGKPATVCDPDTFRGLFYPNGAPTKLDDYLQGDIPQLGLHVVSFADRTIVSIYWPHGLMDAMGKRAMIEAWMLILQGRVDEVRPPQGWDVDPLATLGTQPKEPHALTDRRMSLFSLAQWALWNIGDFLRAAENRMVCVPASFLAKLQAEAAADLKQNGEKSEDKVPFLSEGDVLCAWWSRIAASHLSPSSSRLVVLQNAFSLRAPLGGDNDLLPACKGAYVSNAIGFIPVVLPVRELLGSSLGHVAAAIRRTIITLGTRAQVEAFAALWRSSGSKVPPFFGGSGMHMITISNWAKARMFETDFSAAVVAGTSKPGRDARKIGRPVYIQNNQFGLILPNGFPIIGKDADGNYWLSGYMAKGHWPKIEKILAASSEK